MKTFKLKLLMHPRDLDCECHPPPGSKAHVSRLSCQFPDLGLLPPAWVRSSPQRAAGSSPVWRWTSINTSWHPLAQRSRPADRPQSPSSLQCCCRWPGLTSRGQDIQASASSPRQPHSTSEATEAQKVKDLVRGHTATEQGNECVHMHVHAYNPHVHMCVSRMCNASGPGTLKPIIKRAGDPQLIHTHTHNNYYIINCYHIHNCISISPLHFSLLFFILSPNTYWALTIY